MKLQILRKLIPIACLLVSMNVLAYDFKSGRIYYNITSTEAKTVEVTNKDSNYNSYTGEVTIPSSVTHAETTFKVTSIGYEAFYGCSGLTSITIPNSVTSIGYEAFYGCSGLTSVTIPNSVTQIGNNVFDNCTSLKDLKIEDGTEILELGYNYYYLSPSTRAGLFYDCPLETVYLGRNLSYNTNKSYGYSPFYYQEALKTITIGNSVTSIGDYAFSGCSGLTSVTFESITPPSIGQYAFYNVNATFKTPFASVLAYKAILKDKAFASHEVEGFYYMPISETEVEVTFKDKNYESYTGEVVIPSEITVDEKKYNVTSIGENVFSDCSGLTSVTIPNSVTQIGNNVFDNCKSLKDLKIEDGTEILKLGYNYDSSYTGNGLFYDCPLETVYLGRNLSYNTNKSYGYSPFYYQEALKTITIGNSVTSIGDYAFYNCSGLTSITIPNSVTSIGERAFSNCSGLTSVTIPNSATSVGNYAFNGCTSLKDLKIEDGTEILELGYNNYYGSSISGEGLFYDCPLETVYLGRNLSYNTSSSYGYSPFYNQEALKTITIGNSVTSIGSHAFSGCSGLTSVTFESITPPSIGQYAFYNVNATFKVPYTSILAYKAIAELKDKTFGGFEVDGIYYLLTSDMEVEVTLKDKNYKSYTGEVVIPSEITVDEKKYSVTSIGYEAFSDCSGLTSVTIPNSVTSIGDEAFYKCN